MMKDMKEDCIGIIGMLNDTLDSDWAKSFVRLKMSFWRRHCMGLIFTTSHGVDFFSNILACLEGRMKWTEEGDYNENFRKFINHYRKQYE
jgi:hypothetical protein